MRVIRARQALVYSETVGHDQGKNCLIPVTVFIHHISEIENGSYRVVLVASCFHFSVRSSCHLVLPQIPFPKNVADNMDR